LVAAVLVAAVDATYWLKKRFFHQDLRVTYLDVGQGCAALLEIPGGTCLLVDGGGFFHNRFDVGARVVAPFLWKKKIGRVETLVLSHPHPDHLNGLLFIAKHFHVKEVWFSGEKSRMYTYISLLNALKKKGISITASGFGTPPKKMGGVRFEFLYPPPYFQKPKASQRWRSTNNNSLVLKVTMGKKSFLFPGDIEREAENELVQLAKGQLDSSVLLAPHHGSKSSSTIGLLDSIKPEVVVFSAGWGNIYHFPHDTVLRRYKKRDCQIYQTNKHGAVTITTNGNSLDTKPFLSDSDM
jgi:competence protein ComEC